MSEKFYKLTRPDGWDFFTGKTINYRESIGKRVRRKNIGKPELCSGTVIHASRNPNDAFAGAEIPCAVFEVTGKPVVEDPEKCGFKQLNVIRELQPEDVFKWDYSLACNPVNPLNVIPPGKITDEHIALLRKWDSVWDPSVRASVEALVWESVRDSDEASAWGPVWEAAVDSAWASAWGPVWASVWESLGVSAAESVWDPVWVSVRALGGAYAGYIFRNVTSTWKDIDHKPGEYPFQSAVDLWNIGLVPSYDGKKWRLHGGEDMEILWEGEL